MCLYWISAFSSEAMPKKSKMIHEKYQVYIFGLNFQFLYLHIRLDCSKFVRIVPVCVFIGLARLAMKQWASNESKIIHVKYQVFIMTSTSIFFSPKY